MRIGQVAGQQRGRIATRQLVAAGISSSAVGRRALTGRLWRVYRGVFIVGHTAPIAFGDETSALLAIGDDAALGGISAGGVWDLISTDSTTEPVHVVLARDCRHPSDRIHVHQSRVLAPTDLRVHRDLPVLSPARTLLDLAEQTTQRRTELAVDRALVANLVSHADLLDVIRRARTRHGAKVLAELMADAGPTTVSRSEAEERVLRLIRQADLPAPRVNVRLHGYEVDFYWPAHQLVLEVDGYRFHHTRRAFEHDRRKDASLQAAGIGTMRVTWRHVVGEPLGLIARLAQALADRRRRAG